MAPPLDSNDLPSQQPLNQMSEPTEKRAPFPIFAGSFDHSTIVDYFYYITFTFCRCPERVCGGVICECVCVPACRSFVCMWGCAQFANKDVLCMIIINKPHIVSSHMALSGCVRMRLHVHVFVCLCASCEYQCHFKSLSIYNHQGQKALSPTTEINKSGWQQIKQRGEQSKA